MNKTIRGTGTKTQREAVVTAIAELDQRRRLEELADQLGTFEDVMAPEELDRSREGDSLKGRHRVG